MANFVAICNGTGTIAWRVWPIFNALREQGHKCEILVANRATDAQYEAIMKWADVLILQMVANDTLLKDAKERGIYTIFDCDDLIDEVPPKHPQFKVTNDKAYQALFKRMIKQVDLMLVTNQQLKDHYGKYAVDIKILPNYLPDYFWEKKHAPNTSKTLRFGWAGGVSHQEDLDFILPVVEDLTKEFPTSKFVYTGGGGWDNQKATAWKFGDDQFGSIPYSHKEYNPGSRVEVWPDCLNAMRLDVAMAPLDDNRFSRHKSTIKYFEYSINRWAGVYQKFLYEDVVKHGKTGFLATTKEEWFKYVKLLLEDGELRKQIGESAYRDVKDSYSFTGSRRDEWVNAYQRAAERSRTGANSLFVK